MSTKERFFALNLLPPILIDEDLKSEDWAVALAFIAYAAGDAFGAAHEFVNEKAVEIPSELLGKPEWPYGGVSDDTTLSLLTIASLQQDTPDEAAAKYLELLHQSQATLRGLGPTTRFALGMSVKPEEQHLIGVSNGGMMRTALLGMVFSPIQKGLREAWVESSVKTTHQNPIAINAALDLSEVFSRAITQGLHCEIPLPPNNWEPPATGISLNPRETFNAVLYVASRVKTVEKAFIMACELGGDTDTVAALAGSLIAAKYRADSEILDIPWLFEVNWSEIPQMKDAIDLLIKRRREWAQ